MSKIWQFIREKKLAIFFEKIEDHQKVEIFPSKTEDPKIAIFRKNSSTKVCEKIGDSKVAIFFVATNEVKKITSCCKFLSKSFPAITYNFFCSDEKLSTNRLKARQTLSTLFLSCGEEKIV